MRSVRFNFICLVMIGSIGAMAIGTQGRGPDESVRLDQPPRVRKLIAMLYSSECSPAVASEVAAELQKELTATIQEGRQTTPE